MAKWRPLHRNVTTSDKMLKLAHDGHEFAQWLWTALLPYTDRAGRLNGNPLALLGTIFEGYPYTPEKLEAGLHTLADVGLVIIYRTARHQLLVEYTNFEELNIFDKREAQSQLPGPTDDGSEVITPNTPPVQAAFGTPSEHPKETTGEAQGAPGSSQPLHVHVHKQLHLQSTDTLSSKNAKEADPPGEQLAATPPREQFNPDLYQEIWNTNRGRLPAVTTINRKRKSQIRALIKEHGEAEAASLLRDATRAVASDDFWLERQYGFDVLLAGNKILARAEQYRAGATQLGAANIRLAANVERWGRALPDDEGVN